MEIHVLVNKCWHFYLKFINEKNCIYQNPTTLFYLVIYVKNLTVIILHYNVLNIFSFQKWDSSTCQLHLVMLEFAHAMIPMNPILVKQKLLLDNVPLKKGKGKWI